MGRMASCKPPPPSNWPEAWGSKGSQPTHPSTRNTKQETGILKPQHPRSSPHPSGQNPGSGQECSKPPKRQPDEAQANPNPQMTRGPRR